ncbi:MAG: signal recognition particle-docking protein FtsY [Candidatus Pacearchaeota archaeon]
MFGFLKKKIKEFITGVKEEVVEEAKEEEQELKQELKETKREIEEVKEEIMELKAEEKGERDVEKKIEEKKAELEEQEEEKELEEKKEGLFSKLKKVFAVKKIGVEEFDEFFNKLELILIENNVAIAVIDALRENLKKELVGKEIKRKEFETEIENALKNAISSLLIDSFNLIERVKDGLKEKSPYVIVFFGINGSGKTTTIAKIAYLLKQNKITSVLAAADTFRAASIEQLEKHGSKLGIEVIKQKYGADPAAVAFDAIAHAKSKGIDVVLVDTAGRMHTKSDLLREMEKIVRVTKPSLKIFVGEAITGNDAVEQAKAFNDAIGIDAVILTKADVDEKGGATISISHVTNKPILFLGIGQEYGALKPFDKKQIIQTIFS